MKSIGFIGVGTMGLPMALNLIKKGHSLSFFDPYAINETIFALTDVGAKQDNNIADLCDGKDFVISMLPIGKNVKDVALGEDGIINQENTDLIFIDMSTILPADTIASASPSTTAEIAKPILVVFTFLKDLDAFSSPLIQSST